ncbi:MAG TPA: sigma-70 family RNA polymerase sigma factor, partial [Gaiellaceae bacterium]
MDEHDAQAAEFERHRPHLQAVAYRMLGSRAEAEDALQEAWLKLSRADAGGVANMRGWLTTVVGRVCLDLLRARRARREDAVGSWLPEPIVVVDDGADPEYEAVVADSVGMALFVVLETLTPAERLAFVLHDMFAVPFSEIAEIAERSPDAVRQLASRARRRVRGAAPVPDPDLARQRKVVDAFLAAARGGDMATLLSLLAPDAVMRADLVGQQMGTEPVYEGAAAVAARFNGARGAAP